MYSGSTTTIHSFVSISMCSFLADSLKEREREREREREERESGERESGCASQANLVDLLFAALGRSSSVCVRSRTIQSNGSNSAVVSSRSVAVWFYRFHRRQFVSRDSFWLEVKLIFTQSSQSEADEWWTAERDLICKRCGPRDRRLTCCAFLFNPADSQIATRRAADLRWLQSCRL